MKAERLEKIGGTWRIYFPAHAFDANAIREAASQWCDENGVSCSIRRSHMRFRKEVDATVAWLHFR